jgi:adenylate cyclase
MTEEPSHALATPAARPGNPAEEERRQRPALAVLPFTDASPEGSEGYLCEGIADEVLLALNRIDALRVVSRTSSFPFGDANLGPQDVGRRLGVRQVLTGRLVHAGPELHLDAELVDVGTGRTLWKTRLAPSSGHPGEVVEAVAFGVADCQGVPRPALRRRAVGLEAYDLYLQGRQAYYRYDRHGMRFALQCYRRALEADPAYAEAWAGVANWEANPYLYLDRSETHRQQAESASLRALELDPDLAEAHASRGAALSAGRGEEAFEAALRLDPNLYEAACFYARH